MAKGQASGAVPTGREDWVRERQLPKGEEMLSLSDRGQGLMRMLRRTGTLNPETK